MCLQRDGVEIQSIIHSTLPPTLLQQSQSVLMTLLKFKHCNRQHLAAVGREVILPTPDPNILGWHLDSAILVRSQQI
eukprot:m.162953 g.162953  ORF g.162953 m.162953 type:complete len:77 (-) comp16546_c0_seq1:3338-3568(-)